MKLIYSNFCVFLISILNVNAQTYQWAKQQDNIASIGGNNIAADAAGNSYVIGNFSGTVNFGGISLTSNGGIDVIVLKYDPNGNILWAKQFGGINEETGQDIAVDASGTKIYITGSYSGSIVFDANTLTSTGSTEVFLAQLNSTGDVNWTKSAGGADRDEVGSLAIDPSGNSYIAGTLSGTINFGSFSLSDWGYWAYVAKYDVNGNFQWATKGSTIWQKSLTISCSGYNVYLAGKAVWAPTGFISKYDVNTGARVWEKTMQRANITGVATDATGNSYLSGIFTANASFDSYSITGGNNETFIAKYDDNGDAVWAYATGAKDAWWAEGDIVLSQNNIYIATVFAGTANLGSASITSNGYDNSLIAKYDLNGNFKWAQHTKGTYVDRTQGIAADGNGNIFSTGLVVGQCTFSYSTIINNGGSSRASIFTAKSNEYIQTGNVTGICAGAGIAIPFNTSITFNNGNIFTAQLSNAAGSFNTPTNIGTYAGTTSGVINATIPPSLTGTAYRIRVIASDPYTLGTSSNNLSIYSLTAATFNSVNPVCINTPAFTLTEGISAGGVYSGTGVIADTFDPSVAGVGTFNLTYTFINANGCITSAMQSVTVNPLPTATLAPFNNTGICQNASGLTLTGGLPVGGIYSGSGVSSGTFDPSIAGVGTHMITYTYTNANGCSASANQPITVIAPSNETALPFQWVKQQSNIASTGGSQVAVDASGNSYALGNFSGIITFGSISFTSAGNQDFFVAKYDGTGNLIWVKQFGGTMKDAGNDISVDALSNNVFITGTFNGTVNLQTVSLISTGGSDAFTAKLDANGTIVWAGKVGGNEVDKGTSITTDEFGNAYVAGTFLHASTFGSFTINNWGWNVFVVKYDANGNIIWAKKGSAIHQDATSISYSNGTLAVSVNEVYSGKSYISNYNTSIGTRNWEKTILNANNMAVTIDGNGNSYITGIFTNTATFGATTITGAYHEIYIAKYDNTGNLIFAKPVGAKDGWWVASDIAIESSGNNFYVSSVFMGTANFGCVSVTSNGYDNHFIAKYDATGNFKWVQHPNGNYYDRVSGIAVDQFDNVYATGVVTGSTTFGTVGTVANGGSGNSNFYIAKLSLNSIGTGTIPNVVCSGSQITVPYTALGSFNSANTFTAQLSNAAGNFNVPTVIGSVVSSGSGSITVTIPSAIPSGNNYRIRVVSDSPATIGTDNGSNIQIDNLPTITIAPVNPVCDNSSEITLSASPAMGVFSGNGISGDTFSPAITGAGNQTITYTYITANGCTNSTSTVITVYGSPLADAGIDQTTYYGYTPTECATIGASASGDVYSWSNGATTSSTSVCPSITTDYTLTVTNSFGCINTDDVIINVVDVAGNGNTVVVCHNGVTMNVAPNAVQVHLNHGDDLGPCPQLRKGHTEEVVPIENHLEHAFKIYPNPFSNNAQIELWLETTSNVKIELFDLRGVLVQSIFIGNLESNEYKFNLNASELASGMYFVRYSINDHSDVAKIMIER